jgi:cell division septation protein DedD
MAPPTQQVGTTGAFGQERRTLLIAGLAGVALLAILGVLFLTGMLGGGKDSSLGSGAAATVPHAATATPTASPSPAPFVLAPAAYTDPFAPLPEEVASAAAAAAATAASAAPVATTPATTTDTSTTGTSGTVTPTPSASASPSAGATAGTTSSTAGGSTPAGLPVQVMKITGSSAGVQVDSAPYTVVAGSTFAGGYTCVAVSSGSVKISHNGTVHTLADGELQTF